MRRDLPSGTVTFLFMDVEGSTRLLRNEQTLATIRTQLDEAAVAEAWERGRALTVDEAVSLAIEAVD